MPERVLILGGGFAGRTAAAALAGHGLDVTLVDQHNYHLFQPLLYQVATGELLGEVIATPLRRLLQRPSTRFRLGEVASIHLAERSVDLANGDSLSYDYLFITLGTQTNFFGNASIARHALDIKGLEAAEAARSHLFQALEHASHCQDAAEQAAWLRFVIAGGGAAGVEFGAALQETLREMLPREYPELPLSRVQVILIHGAEALLPGFASALQQHAARRLQRLGVELRLGTHVKSYDGRLVVCDSGEPIATHTLVWTAGVTAAPMMGDLEVEQGHGGRLLVDAHLRLETHPEVFVAGDLAISRAGSSWPQVAPFALQSARHAAAVLLAQHQRQPLPPPFSYQDPGSMAVLGRLDAVCQIRRWRWHGFSAWLLWLLLHIYRIIGTGNRLRTLLDWSSDYLRRNAAVQLIRGSASPTQAAQNAEPPR